jgi:NTE family protein
MYQLRDFVAVSLVFFSSVSGLSQVSHNSGTTPKLGLALEGGGALGLAHIGVIQYLEQHRIPVSYIAGTSLGDL